MKLPLLYITIACLLLAFVIGYATGAQAVNTQLGLEEITDIAVTRYADGSVMIYGCTPHSACTYWNLFSEGEPQ